MLDSIVGRAVTHKILGAGTITSRDNNHFSVQFASKTMKFVYPNAFEAQHLKTEDTEFLEQIAQDIVIAKQRAEAEAKEKAEAKAAVKAAEAEAKAEAEAQEKAEKALLRRQQSAAASGRAAKPRRARATKKDETPNPAFKCTYCDGGAIPGVRVGFCGVCSDEQIRHNTQKRTWCSQPDCDCMQYISGQINRDELLSKLSNGGRTCYESVMFRDWRAAAGWHRHGKHKGEPIPLIKARPNSLAVLTTIEPDTPQEKCFIFCAFLIDEFYKGDTTLEGYVAAEPTWRIELTPAEAHQMPFWKYYVNSNSPDNIKWGTGLVRYLSDIQAAQILQDIVEVKTKPAEKDFAQQFLDHYCKLHAMDSSNIAPPNGALVRG